MIEVRIFASRYEIQRAIAKLERRIEELEQLDIRSAILGHSGADDVVISNIRETIREVFGQASPEFEEHKHIRLWAGPMYINMNDYEIITSTDRGRTSVNGVLNGLINRLREKAEDIGDGPPTPSSYFSKLNLHPRISDVASDLFVDGYHSEAVFAASKALINYVKDRSGRHDLDGTGLVRTVFSKNAPILSFNALADQTDADEQEGMMHLFEGAVMAIRNPGGHSFPEGSEQRALEYISLLSLLAYRVQESKRVAKS
ncbi:MAG: TIGR02391 family protein [Gemmatimonadaceae bacterium]|nr:TIGR02391 family protein [Gemmatimonadaceae bacterium]